MEITIKTENEAISFKPSKILSQVLNEDILPSIIQNNNQITTKEEAMKRLLEELLRLFVRQNMRL